MFGIDLFINVRGDEKTYKYSFPLNDKNKLESLIKEKLTETFHTINYKDGEYFFKYYLFEIQNENDFGNGVFIEYNDHLGRFENYMSIGSFD